MNSKKIVVKQLSQVKKNILFLFILTLISYAFPVHSTPLKNTVTLTVKPKLCILNNERQTRKDKIIISWKSNSALSLCLFSNKKQSSLACWHDSWSGETEQLIKTQESLMFYLKDEQKIVAQKKLEVFKNFAKRNKRSRKRHPWSIF